MKKRSVQRLVNLLMVLSLLSPCVQGGSATAQVEYNQTVTLPYIVNSFVDGFGMIHGQVIEEASGDPLAEASVCIEDNCILTDEDGQYQFSSLRAGLARLTASKDIFKPYTASVVVITDADQTVNFKMRHDLGARSLVKQIILTWREEEYWYSGSDRWDNDLDNHLYFESLQSRHLYPGDETKGSCEFFPYACIEHDETHGSGPETLSIVEYRPGTYYYGVLHHYYGYSGVPSLPEMQAKVNVTDKSGEEIEFTVPVTGTGDFWFVFIMDGTGVVTPTNCITAYPGDNPPTCP